MDSPAYACVYGLTQPLGFRAAGGTCGIKASGKPDLMLLAADAPCAAAAVFTTNRMTSAPVDLDRAHLRAARGRVRAVVVNSGNANASTGKPGYRNAQTMCRQVAQALGCQTQEVLVASTGIIGRPLPMEKILPGIDALAGQLTRGPDADRAAAAAIMTTDLVPKGAVRQVKIGGRTVTLAGICKGSGMIAPNMATMLAFLTTDAAITPALLQRALRQATVASFNRISVDQHTSPSDTCLLLASGAAGHRPITRADASLVRLTAALTDLCRDLAYQIVRDGEGATRVYRVRVRGTATEAQADRIARCIVDSPLVKCAVHGGDPNWGRITTAAGYAGVAVQAQAMSLYIGPRREVCVFRRGQPTPAGSNPPPALKALMKQPEVTLTLVVGRGPAQVEWLGCDLSREYVRINADYTT